MNIQTNLLPKGERLLVALSGGADSVCLLHALHGLAEANRIELEAAHFIHGIRPEPAEREAAFVQRLCDSLGIRLHIGRGDVPAYAAKAHMGIEEAARELRYSFLYAVADQRECAAIAVAHNLGDNAETMLFNLSRVAGLAGLGGIPAVNGLVIRPLLGVSRQEIEEYNRGNGLEWLTDESNADQRYSRNRIRHAVLPQLRQVHPEADRAMARAAANLSQAQDFILQSALSELGYDRQLGMVDRRVLRSVHPALQHPMLTLLLQEIKADPHLLDARKTDRLLRLALGDRSTGRMDLGGGVEAVLLYTDLWIRHRKEDPEPDPEVELTPGVTVRWNGWEIRLDAETGVAFDRDAVEGPVIVRSRRPGDRIAMAQGHKSIKKILIDQKIPSKTRDRIPVICDNKKVLLLGDLEQDRRIIAKNENLLRISCRRIRL